MDIFLVISSTIIIALNIVDNNFFHLGTVLDFIILIYSLYSIHQKKKGKGNIT